MKLWPETETQCKERCMQLAREACTHYDKSDKKVLHICATHAALVKWFAEGLGGIPIEGWSAYCAISGIEISAGGSWQLIFDNYADHIYTK